MPRAARNAKNILGVCTRCKEWTTVHEPCCGRGVVVEGSVIDPDDYCSTCGDELNSGAKCDRCDVKVKA